jgi:Asp-tRNA(Asn)/Glu-tRNA(Gln) amidotransferase C subunit
MTGALRPDRARASLPREVVLERAPDAGDEGFLVPSPQA